MTANWEKTGTNDGVLTFEISEEIIKQEMDKVFNKVKKNVSINSWKQPKSNLSR